MTDCVFCRIVNGLAPATVVGSSMTSLIIEPLGPQVPGHVLVIPRNHVTDATSSLSTTSATMHDAAAYAAGIGPCNIITSVGSEATQSVFHLHIHVLPRGERDGLRKSWPWVRRDLQAKEADHA